MVDVSTPIHLHQARRSPLAWLAAGGALLVVGLGVAEFVSPAWLARVLNLGGEPARWQWLAIPAGILALGVLAQVLGYPEVITSLDPAQRVIHVETRRLGSRLDEPVPLHTVADIRPVRTSHRPEYRLVLITTAGQRLVLDHQPWVDPDLVNQRAQAIKRVLQGYGLSLA